MSGSRGGGSRLSRKRKNEESSQSQLAVGLHDVTDDFEDIATVFRLPKRAKVEKLLGPRRSRGRPKKSEGKISAERPDSKISIYDEDDFSDTASLINDKASQEVVELEGNDFDLELDESFLCKDEKLCGSCKHIVPAAIYGDHLKECLQKFKATKRSTRSGSSDSALPFTDNQENEKPNEKNTAGIQGKRGVQTLPCPICLKPLKSKTARQSHIKSCGQTHGLDSEKLVLAVRLQEKQAEERNLLGLPPVAIEPSSIRQDKENEAVAPARPKRKASSATSSSKDPDLAMAIALSRSMAEEEAEKRASQEEKLLALGFDKIVEEDRKVKPVVLLPITNASQKANNTKEKGRGAKGRKKFRCTVLATRSAEERERIISEKVASILTSDVTANVNWNDNDSQGGRDRLAKFRDEGCILWNSAQSSLERPLEEFYVKDLDPYIQPKKAEVGRLHRRLSDIPGRLNVTVMHAMDENSDGDSDEEENSVVDGYCTQLALAELLGSQELNITLAQRSLPSLDLTAVQDLEDPVPGPNVTLEAASGFWLVHPEESREASPQDGATVECLEAEEIRKKNSSEVFKRSEDCGEKSDEKSSSKRDLDLTENSEIPDDGNARTRENLQVHNSEKISSSEKYSDESKVQNKNEKLKEMKRLNDILKLSNTCDSNKDDLRYDSDSNKKKNIRFNQMTKDNLCDDGDSEIVCVLDTSIEDTKRHHLSSLTTASNVVTYESERPHRELGCSLQNDDYKDQVLDSDVENRVGSSSPASSDSDKTEIFDDGKGRNSLHNLDEIDFLPETAFAEVKHTGKEGSAVGKTSNLERDISDCNLNFFSEKARSSQPTGSNEGVNVHGTNSFLLQSKNSVVDSESDEEGGAKTIIYDDASSKDFLSPSKDLHVGEICEDADDDLDCTIPFQNQGCNESHNSGVLKDFTSSKESCSPSKLLSPLLKHENCKTNITTDADETDLYINEDKVQYKIQQGNEDDELRNQDLKGSNRSDSQLNNRDLQETLVNEAFSTAGDTIISAAFEETIPREAANKAEETVLYDDAVNDQETMPFQDLSKLDRTLPHQLVSDQDETLPYQEMDECGTVLPDDSSADVSILHQKTAQDRLEEAVNDQDETLSYEDIDEDATVLRKDSPKDKTPFSLQKSQNGIKKVAVTHPSNVYSNSTNVKHSSVEVVRAPGINIDKRDTLIQNSPLINVSLMQKRTSESCKAGDCSNTMHTRLIYDWSSLFASSEESDVTITTADGEELSAHAIVLLARCPDLYGEVKSSNKHLMWNEVSYNGAYVFLAYLYNGECSIKTKDDPHWMDVFDLALKYNCEELVSHLESLYKIANSPVKNKESSIVESDLDFALPRLSSKCPENVIENSVSKEKSSFVLVEKNSSLKRGLFPLHTSTVIRDSTVPLQTSNEVKASSSVDELPIVTPCRRRGTGNDREKIVRRCLDLSSIEKGVLLGSSSPSEAHQNNESNARSCQSPESINRSTEKNSQHPHGSQSPDLFDSTVMEEVSFITTPAKSPLTLPSPENINAVGSPKDTNNEKVVDEIEMTDITSPEPCSSNVLQNLSGNVTCESAMETRQLDLDSKRPKEQRQVDTSDIDQHDNDASHTSKTNMSKEDNIGVCTKLPDIGDDDGEGYSDNESRTNVDNLIDLTNDSSDDSVSGFSVANNNVTSDVTDFYAVNADASTEEDMESLKLVDSEESMNDNSISHVNEERNKCNKANDIEMAIDITHSSPRSSTSDTISHINEAHNNICDKESDIEMAVDLTQSSPRSSNSDSISHVNEACNDICDKENDIEITHPSPRSTTIDQEDIRMADKENEMTSYISNVWDDFDDVCGNLIDAPVTPVKESDVESADITDLPSVEKLDSRDSNDIMYSQKYRDISTKSSDSGKSSSSHNPLNELADEASDLPSCSKDFRKPSLSSAAVVKPSAGVPTISDTTMANVREVLEDSSLWRDEFEPVFDVEEETEKEMSTTDGLNRPNHLKTPQQKIGVRKSVTPMPAYKEMPSPELKNELKKYGIKPISKKKAVTILEHIYEKTHPLVTDSEADSSYCETPQQPRAEKGMVSAIHKKALAQNQTKSKNLEKKPINDSTKGRKVVKASASKTAQPIVDEEDDDENPLNCSQTSTTSSEGSQPDCFEESVLHGTGDDDTDLTATQQGDLANQVAQYIVSDPEFHQKILLYEPFFIEDLQASLKANGVKCNMKNMLEILDNQCITFRTHQGQRIRQRGRRCKRKNGTPSKTPTKRAKKS